MKRVKHIALVAAAVAMTSVSTGAVAAIAVSNISATKHNLSSSSTGNGTSATTEICVFCHTPHGADTAGGAPLWNRTVTDSTLFQTYDQLGSSTLDGTVAAVGSVSLACLSCHDGQIAMDSLLNTPGSGTVADLGWAFNITPSMGLDGKLVPTAITNIGLDLRNDHPVGILYAGGGVDTTPAQAEFKDADFVVPTHETINGGSYWYVDTPVGVAGERTRTDMILYTRNEGDGDKPYVECASCHDPHVESFDVASEVAFLRVSNTGSQLCLACHIK